MEPVRFTAAPKSSFNWDRPPSDLLQSQLKHFKHLEKKLDLGVDPALGSRLGTENGAAIYIAAITKALRTRALAAKARPAVAAMPLAKPAAASATPEPLSLAASAASDEAPHAPAATTSAAGKRKSS